jgi:micrococcal nuclease
MNDSYLHHYKAKVLEVYDGDTVRLEIDLGFGMTWRGSDGRGVQIRLFGLNTPEVRGSEREQGLISRDRLREQILDKYITLKTIRDKTGKYGRYLGILLKEDGTNLNEWLISEGLAERREY